MSADLFAEFSSGPAPSATQDAAGKSTSHVQFTSYSHNDGLRYPTSVAGPADRAASQRVNITVEDGDDEWGDFEGGDAAAQPGNTASQAPSFTNARTHQLASTPLSTQKHVPVDLLTSTTSWPTAAEVTRLPSRSAVEIKVQGDPTVLFDAETAWADENDFGDFEGQAADTTKPAHASSAVDLLGDLSLEEPLSVSPEASASSNMKQPGLVMKDKDTKSRSASAARMPQVKDIEKPAAVTQDKEWETFEAWEESIPTAASKAIPAHVGGSTSTTSPTEMPTLSLFVPIDEEYNSGQLPPTNVPPPAVLLTLFPPLFSEAQEKLFKPMATQDLPMRNRLLSRPDTLAFLQSYLMVAKVATYVIAGRKLRWKRDQHLSQGMRIGPASSRATSGMKLSSIDKSESLKEDREAADVARAWKDQAGRLRHVVSAASQIKSGSLDTVPDIQETMPVRTLKQVEGGVPAPRPCMLCGLKRDERVGQVDHGVEDSFGEFWVEQTSMHRGEFRDLLFVPLALPSSTTRASI